MKRIRYSPEQIIYALNQEGIHSHTLRDGFRDFDGFILRPEEFLFGTE